VIVDPFHSRSIGASNVVVEHSALMALDTPVAKGGARMVVLVRRGVQRNPDRLQREMEEVFRALLPARRSVHVQSQGTWRPPLEVYETEKSLVILAEIAGIDEDDLNIVADSGMISIRGQRRDRRHSEQRRYREIGIAYGEFVADVFLPFPVDLDQADAEYDKGLLRIELPRIAPKTIVPRQIGSRQEREEDSN
jgi:HSP20 family molecular chaperone IbpA